MPTILGSASITLGGSWTSGAGGSATVEYNGENYYYHASGTGSNTATWQFTGLTAGASYQIARNWVPYGNRATNSPWQILDSNGSTVLSSGTKNEQNTPASDYTGGSGPCPFEKLGTTVTPSGTSLSVKVTDNANGFVTVDAVYLTLISAPSSSDGAALMAVMA